jgi:hypothetical protein
MSNLDKEFDEREPVEDQKNPPIPVEYYNGLIIGENSDHELLAVARKGDYTFLLRWSPQWQRWNETRTASETEIRRYDRAFLKKMHCSEEKPINDSEFRTEFNAIIRRHKHDMA